MGTPIACHDTIRQARLKFKLTGEAVTKKLEISAPACRRYERGEVAPSSMVFLRLEELYNTSTDAVRRGDGGECGGYLALDPPLLNRSTVMYVNGIEEGRYAKEALQAGRDRNEATLGRCSRVAG